MVSMGVIKALGCWCLCLQGKKMEDPRKLHALTLNPPHIHLLKQHNHWVLANRLWWLSLWLASELSLLWYWPKNPKAQIRSPISLTEGNRTQFQINETEPITWSVARRNPNRQGYIPAQGQNESSWAHNPCNHTPQSQSQLLRIWW